MDIGYIGAFLGGILSLLSPCSVMLLPAFFAYAFTSPAKLLSRTGVFLLGLLVTLIPLGVFSGLFGSLLGENRGILITTVAVLVIAVGLVQLLGVPIPGLTRSQKSDRDSTSVVSVFLLGAVYAIAGVCTGPILGSVLMVASIGGSALYGAILLAVYALGMVLPLVVLTLLWRAFGGKAMTWMRPRMLRIGRWQNSWTLIITGALSITLGVLLLVTDGTADLGGVVGIETQFAMETAVSTISARVPDWWFAVGALIMLAIVSAIVLLRRRQDRSTEPAEDQPSGVTLDS
ncbi:Cytochrome c-type biogenesis protein CcdA (DsbD analog) [Microbacterium esteraromaticum]|uniref:Cytochrome c-type biogenesis protein CcdA (DsbD analog) n=1 Tax=Microbacterium esteraromaticum TaxID=57043 RepID=A0A1R4JN54_9MICO|nr:cytochrome c biogenesis CcdA family protein [Microbacterium esteraromaticum]SJN33456.1 Cytochrome c-type biogenesis protein CcdA (DsbD analog) [Microbacterium esteraromaticum]